MLKNKTTLHLAFALLLTAFFGSCKKQDLPVKPAPSDFSAVLQRQSPFSADGGKDTILINGNTNGWWVTMEDNEWVTVPKKFGSGNYKLPLTAKANTTGIAREVNIVIHPTFGLSPVEIKVAQSD